MNPQRGWGRTGVGDILQARQGNGETTASAKAPGATHTGPVAGWRPCLGAGGHFRLA